MNKRIGTAFNRWAELGLVLGLATAAPTPAHAQAPDPVPDHADVLVFENGDLLQGRFDSLDPNGECRWLRNDVEEPIRFRSEALAEIRFGQDPLEPFRVGESWRLYLANYDELEGRLLGMDASRIRVDLLNAGPVEIPREMVRIMIPILKRLPPLFSGFNEPESWSNDQVEVQGIEGDVWKYGNGAYYAFKAASLAREVNLPDTVSISMDLAWKGALNLAIGLYTDSLQPINLLKKEQEPPFRGFYSLAIFTQGAVLRGINQKDPIRNLGQVFLRELAETQQASIEILADKSQRVIQLVIDGRAVKTWFDTEGFIGEGHGLRFVHQGKGAIRMSHLEVRRWNGQINQRPDLSTPIARDAFELADGTQYLGRVQEITGGSIRIERPNDTQDVPLNQVRIVTLARKSPNYLFQVRDPVRLTFRNGDLMTVTLRQANREALEVDSPGIGSLQIPRRRISSLKFIHPVAANRLPKP